ncbi:MAG: hypothetical protein IKU61_06870 [Clostridia bacterium]|nr:hypothetical protein [Clostridia bacterium]
MKVCVIQPPYSFNYEDTEKCFKKQLELMDACDDSLDIIVLPEACDIPSLAKTKEQSEASEEKYNKIFLEKAAETAKRCGSILFANARSYTEAGARNTTYAFDREGNIVGKYYKEHLTPGESSKLKLDDDYTFEHTEPTIIEIEGLRFAFLVCYDFYFYENYANIARYKPDFIIGNSHQRSDAHKTLEFFSQFLAYNTNAYVLRSSVSLGADSPIGGASMIVAPDGSVLGNLYNDVGMICAEIDPAEKLYKPAGFGGAIASHPSYVEDGRRPWKYRNSGSAVVRHDAIMKYPRVCAHRGFNTIAPENSMPAFGAAVAMGAEEIEFDLWYTKDREIVSIHDSTLDRVSDGYGKVYDYTYEELLAYDFGIKYGEKFKGLKILLFEDILKKFACHTVMNIHIKACDMEIMKKIVALIDKYDCRKYVYFMAADDIQLMAKEIAPDICRCASGGGTEELRWKIVDRAIALGCKKAQLCKPCFNQEMIDKAHANGIRCNVFWSDDPDETRRFLEMGIDTILTNDYQTIAEVVKEYKK